MRINPPSTGVTTQPEFKQLINQNYYIMHNYSELRVGNPVEVNEEITFVTEVIEQNGEVVYKVYGFDCSFRSNEMYPVRMDQRVQRTYEYSFFDIDTQCTEGVVVFHLNGQSVEYDFSNATCYINRNIVPGIDKLHQLFNLVEDITGYKFPHYYPIGERSINENAHPIIKVAPAE